ncbi:tyrosine-type recombinase/integrase [Alicyclobacillus tolerans]|uniref:Integrase/recombinase XerD n=1 Tax=Alicyclobacillus tolerans TaxID=90970 RepID=A0A1M6TSJ9_9BACL|nr:tyrosine-type recombinase/integrase [Alicyclobacillus montanus]SHK59883.1 integrase/recombinase XerD [Alicyclobacillus montanus]
MEKLIEEFSAFLAQGKSENTVKTYTLDVKQYFRWFSDTYGMDCKRLYRENVLDYKTYLLNVRKFKGKHLNAKTVNRCLSALSSFNQFLIDRGVQSDIVVEKSDLIKVQHDFTNPCIIEKSDVEKFRQRILESGDKRLYALVTLLAYAGPRISEALDLKLSDLSLETKELVVRKGKGGKQRTVYLNTKIVTALREYLKVRSSDSEYLFSSRKGERVDRTVMNKLFKRFSDTITPHGLRHFYATLCLQNGFSIHEVASQCGHRDVRTTLIYAHPSRNEMIRKAELL